MEANKRGFFGLFVRFIYLLFIFFYIFEIKWLEQKLSGVNSRVAQSSRGSVAEIFQEVPQLNNSPITPNPQNRNADCSYRKNFFP
jgi:hypothetical protein